MLKRFSATFKDSCEQYPYHSRPRTDRGSGNVDSNFPRSAQPPGGAWPGPFPGGQRLPKFARPGPLALPCRTLDSRVSNPGPQFCGTMVERLEAGVESGCDEPFFTPVGYSHSP